MEGTNGTMHPLDFIGPLHWFPVATDRIVGLSLNKRDQDLLLNTTCFGSCLTKQNKKLRGQKILWTKRLLGG